MSDSALDEWLALLASSGVPEIDLSDCIGWSLQPVAVEDQGRIAWDDSIDNGTVTTVAIDRIMAAYYGMVAEINVAQKIYPVFVDHATRRVIDEIMAEQLSAVLTTNGVAAGTAESITDSVLNGTRH